MLDSNGYLLTKGAKQVLVKLPRTTLPPVDFMSDEELLATAPGDEWILDTECYFNFWFAAFKHLKTGKQVWFEQSPAHNLQTEKLRWMLWRFCTIGFNSFNYDLPIIELALNGTCCENLKKASDFIIKYNNKRRNFEAEYNLKVGQYNHIDLIEVAPLDGSLKLYAGRLHCPRLQDLPFQEDKHLTAEEAELTRVYCAQSDIPATEALYKELEQPLNLRREMGERYKVDLRSKSDAQIAEAVINSELKKILGYWPRKPKVSQDLKLQYNLPDFIKFENPQLQKACDDICNAYFELDKGGKPKWPDGLGAFEKTKSGKAWVLKVTVGKSVYKLGMGGLHSQEECIAHYADEKTEIADNDVESFYPRIILNQGLFPEHLGRAFLDVYEFIVSDRVDAKGKAKALKASDKIAAAGFKSIADSLKIVINGSFGKLGSFYSSLFAPQLMLQVTITGQLVLLMLIEMLEKIGIEVVSGNTDGIISKYSIARRQEVRETIAEWERRTNFKTEETKYKAVLSRDVNNYFAIKEEGGDPEAEFLDDRLGVKIKGCYCERGSALNSILSKNPEILICSDAVIRYLVENKPIAETIKECTDIRRFLTVRNVKGGGAKNGMYLGKVVRFYFAKNEAGYIAYVGSGNKVPKSEGAKPLMDLPESLPEDIDYKYYIEKATEILFEIGHFKKPETLSLF